MSLFGLLFATVGIGAYAVAGVRDKRIDNENKSKARALGELTYTDHRYATRLVSNDEQCHWGTHEGDVVLIRSGGEIIYNKSEEERKYESKICKEYAIAHGSTTYPMSYDYMRKKKIKGMRYKDLQNGKIYVIRSICGCWTEFYVDIETQKIERVTDKEYINLLKKGLIDSDIKKLTDEKILMVEKLIEEQRKTENPYYCNPLNSSTILDLVYDNSNFVYYHDLEPKNFDFVKYWYDHKEV